MAENTPSSDLPVELLPLRVSVILVTYNQGPALRRAVAALETSRGRDQMEIVVVDCGSSDGSTALDTDFPNVNLMRLPHHLGAIRAMNIATRTAKADLLLFLSPEVEVGPETVQELADALDADGDAVAACPLLVDVGGQAVPRVYRLPDRAALEALARGGSLTATAVDTGQEKIRVEYPSLDALLVRKTFVLAMNYFDLRYGQYGGDMDLAMQAKQASKRIDLYAGIRAVYHAAADPLTGDSIMALDKANAAAEFWGKYQGGAFGFRLGLALGALAKFDFGGFAGILGGTKLDGGQR